MSDISHQSPGDRTALAVFALALCLPLLVTVFGPRAQVSSTENRVLAPAPALPRSAEAWRALPEALEAWWGDHMGLRTPLLRAWSLAHVKGLHSSPFESLVVGRDGWLFLGDADALAQARGEARFDGAELARWQRVVAARERWLAERGIAFLFVLVPNKHRVHADRLPAGLPHTPPRSQLDQLAEALAGDAVLDLRPVLAHAREHGPIYHKTDTHWNGAGAWAAAQAIDHALQQRGIAGREIEVRLRERVRPGLGLARIAGLARQLPEERAVEVEVLDARAAVPPERQRRFEERTRRQLPLVLGTGDPALPTAVVFRDSFANELVPLLSERFGRVVWVWDRQLDPRVVERERPDVVIHEMAERFLGHPPLAPEAVRRQRDPRPE